jgi:hypothetical protein
MRLNLFKTTFNIKNMDFLYLTKNGLCTRENKEFLPIECTFSYYLNHYPKIEKGFTVEDFMEILKKNESDVNHLFQAFTKGFLLDAYYQEMGLKSIKEDKSKINKLEFSWQTDLWNIKEFGKPKYELSEYVQVSGIVDGEKNRYSLSFVNLNEIKNATFKLNKNIKINFTDFGDKWDENRKVIKKTFFKGVKQFTFQDIVGCFLNEISFYGYPEQSDEVADELEKQIKNIKNEKTTPLEVLQLQWAKKSLKIIEKKKLTSKNILRLEKLTKEINYLELKIKEIGDAKRE